MTYLDCTGLRLQILNAAPNRSELPDNAQQRWLIGDTDMASFVFLGKALDLPAVKMPTNVATREPTAWQSGNFVTVRLTHPISALRVRANNVGLASAKFGGSGDGLQAEYVGGPPMQFTPLRDKHWHGGSARA